LTSLKNNESSGHKWFHSACYFMAFFLLSVYNFLFRIMKITTALRECGLQSSNLILCIDFNKKNNESSGHKWCYSACYFMTFFLLYLRSSCQTVTYLCFFLRVIFHLYTLRICYLILHVIRQMSKVKRYMNCNVAYKTHSFLVYYYQKLAFSSFQEASK